MRGSETSVREMKEVICGHDRLKVVDKCREKALMIAEVAGRVGCARLWDAALDLGWKAVKGLQLLSRVMSHLIGSALCVILLHFRCQCWFTFWATMEKSRLWSLHGLD